MSKRDADNWFDDREELATFAYVLEACGAFSEPPDVIYYVEKPWKWNSEHEAWVAAGRPSVEGDEPPAWYQEVGGL